MCPLSRTCLYSTTSRRAQVYPVTELYFQVKILTFLFQNIFSIFSLTNPPFATELQTFTRFRDLIRLVTRLNERAKTNSTPHHELLFYKTVMVELYISQGSMIGIKLLLIHITTLTERSVHKKHHAWLPFLSCVKSVIMLCLWFCLVYSLLSPKEFQTISDWSSISPRSCLFTTFLLYFTCVSNPMLMMWFKWA